jgi:hypothetical protein
MLSTRAAIPGIVIQVFTEAAVAMVMSRPAYLAMMFLAKVVVVQAAERLFGGAMMTPLALFCRRCGALGDEALRLLSASRRRVTGVAIGDQQEEARRNQAVGFRHGISPATN